MRPNEKPTERAQQTASAPANLQQGVATDVQVVPAATPQTITSYLRRLNTITRRPIELRSLRLGVTADAVPLPATIKPLIKEIATSETPEFAFRVAELAYRLEASGDAEQDPKAAEGLAVLQDMTRMYEHIFVLQTEG